MSEKTPEPESRPSAVSSTSSPPSSSATPAAASAAEQKPEQKPAAEPKAETAPEPKPEPKTETAPTVPAQAPAPAPAAPAKAAAPAPARPAPPPPVVNAALKKPPKRPKPPREGAGNAPIALAVLALLVAVGSTLVALYALDQAREAKNRAVAAETAARPVAGAPTTRPPAAAPTAAPTATTSPTPAFVSDLVKAELTIPKPANCESIFVDIDTGKTGIYSGHDFYFSTCLGPLSARIDQVQASIPVDPATITPASCADQLRGISQTREVPVLVSPGGGFCLLTSKEAATSQGIPQRIAIVEFKQVAADESWTIAVSTFRVP